jgi:putative endonuclease
VSSGPTAEQPAGRRSPAVVQQRQRLGAAGEAAVARRYEEAGYVVVARNWRDGRRGELDLVVRRGGLVVGVEVKTRSSSVFGDPLEAVTAAKAARLRRLLAAWVAGQVAGQLSGPGREQVTELRIDVAAVRWGGSAGPEIEVIESAC